MPYCASFGLKDTLTIELAHIDSELYRPMIVVMKTLIFLQHNTIFMVHHYSAFFYTVIALIWTYILSCIGWWFVSPFQVNILLPPGDEQTQQTDCNNVPLGGSDGS